jgi:hypothetical protein
VEGQVSDDDSTFSLAVWHIFIQVMADFAMKMRWSAILVVNVVVQVFILLREKPVRQHVQVRNPGDRVFREEKRAVDLSSGNGTKDIQFRRISLMLYGGMRIFSTPDAHVMVIHFSAQMKRCFVTEDQVGCKFVIFHVSLHPHAELVTFEFVIIF